MPEEQLPAVPNEEGSTSQGDSPLEDNAEIPIPSEVLEKLPVEMRGVIAQSFSASAMVSGPMHNPMLEKLTSEHISSLIEAVDKDGDRALEDRKHSRIWQTVIVALLVIPIAILLGYFAFLQQNTLVMEIIKLAAVALGGFGIGLGYGRWRNSH